MTVRYHNENTGDVVEYDEPSARLDALSNWRRVDDGQALPPLVEDGVLSRGASTEPVPSPAPPVEPASATPPENTSPPERSALKAEWVAYALSQAQDSDEEAAIGDLTKEQLIEAYGRTGDE
ncbi:hypothetical protein ABZ883_14880 [Streptomyces sp. NPDC046977]|uniref:hypothetical protein n=1 Tax=Streptomyces sp. NPDC046977 TaxID=3154703 RepID=UPI0033C9ACF9